MIDVYYWPTPNGWKVTILLEELGVPYRLVPVDIRTGAQFAPEFLRISPNSKIPAIVDHQPADGAAPLSIFESAVILQYLADKHGRFLPKGLRPRLEVLQWVAWQVAAFGPTAGQVHHFREYADAPVPYAIERFTSEMNRLYGVLDDRLRGRQYVAGEFSIADIAIWPWARLWRHHGQDMGEFPEVTRWIQEVGARPALNKGFRAGNELREGKSTMTPEARKMLLNQRARRAKDG